MLYFAYLFTFLSACISCFCHVRLCDPMDSSACQAPLSTGPFRQEHWSGLPCSSPDLPHPGIKLVSLTSPALASEFFNTCATWEAALFLLDPSFIDIFASPAPSRVVRLLRILTKLTGNSF